MRGVVIVVVVIVNCYESRGAGWSAMRVPFCDGGLYSDRYNTTVACRPIFPSDARTVTNVFRRHLIWDLWRLVRCDYDCD